MYLRRCFRCKDGKRHAYWALVESYRTNRGPRQRVVAWLGVMDEQGRLGVKHCAEKRPGHQTDLFRSTEPEWVEVEQIRPVWHHREDRVGAHILVCFLAYVLWKTLAASCRQAG